MTAAGRANLGRRRAPRILPDGEAELERPTARTRAAAAGEPEDRALTILLYHGVVESPPPVRDPCFIEESSFRGQMEHLKASCEVLPLSQGCALLRSGRLRRPAVAITFDDGFQNNFDIAFPILRRLGLPATIFLSTGYVDTAGAPWPCRVALAIAGSRRRAVTWNGREWELTDGEARARSAAALKQELKAWPRRQLLERARDLIVQLGADPDSPVAAESPFRMLGRAAIDEMRQSGLVEFGAHTVSHAILSLLPAHERDVEIRRSLRTVSALTGRPCRLFAYPNGLPQDYDAGTLAALQRAGVQVAVTAVAGRNTRDTPLLELRREAVGPNTSLREFRHLVNGRRRGRLRDRRREVADSAAAGSSASAGKPFSASSEDLTAARPARSSRGSPGELPSGPAA